MTWFMSVFAYTTIDIMNYTCIQREPFSRSV